MQNVAMKFYISILRKKGEGGGAKASGFWGGKKGFKK
jgi:hypothetical protein